MKNILIIDCGPSLKEVTTEFGSSPEWIMSCLDKEECNFTWVKPYDGDQIQKKHYDAWIITGSPRSVYDNESWMLDIEQELRLIKNSDILVLGICFGSQLIAKAFGGKVELNPYGWELGAYPIDLTDDGKKSPLFFGFTKNEIVYESHQDCVTILPKGAIELAHNKKGNQSFVLNNNFVYNPKLLGFSDATGATVEKPSSHFTGSQGLLGVKAEES